MMTNRMMNKILLALFLARSVAHATFVPPESPFLLSAARIRSDGRCTATTAPSILLQHPTSTRSHSSCKKFNTISLHISPQEIIEAGVSFDTFAPQFLWLPMIVAPRAQLTKTLLGGRNGIAAIIALALIHLVIVATAAAQDGALDQIKIFAEVFDPSLSQLAGMRKLFQYPNFVAEEWPHVLIWDLFVGRMIWLDGLKRGVDSRVALAFCNGIGPPGFLIYITTCLISGKGLPTMDSTINDNDEESSS